jgi:hypothetical protein
MQVDQEQRATPRAAAGDDAAVASAVPAAVRGKALARAHRAVSALVVAVPAGDVLVAVDLAVVQTPPTSRQSK